MFDNRLQGPSREWGRWDERLNCLEEDGSAEATLLGRWRECSQLFLPVVTEEALGVCAWTRGPSVQQPTRSPLNTRSQRWAPGKWAFWHGQPAEARQLVRAPPWEPGTFQESLPFAECRAIRSRRESRDMHIVLLSHSISPHQAAKVRWADSES